MVQLKILVANLLNFGKFIKIFSFFGINFLDQFLNFFVCFVW